MRTFRVNGEYLRTLRIQKGWTTRELGENAICSAKTVESLEAGNRAYLSSIKKVVCALGADISSVLQDSDTYKTSQSLNIINPVTITINLKLEFSLFDETSDLLDFLNALLRKADVRGAVDVQAVSRGSVVVVIVVDAEDATKFLTTTFTTDFKKWNPISVNVQLDENYSNSLNMVDLYKIENVDVIKNNTSTAGVISYDLILKNHQNLNDMNFFTFYGMAATYRYTGKPKRPEPDQDNEKPDTES